MILSNFAITYIGDSKSTSRISRTRIISISMKVSDIYCIQVHIFFLYREEEMLGS